MKWTAFADKLPATQCNLLLAKKNAEGTYYRLISYTREETDTMYSWVAEIDLIPPLGSCLGIQSTHWIEIPPFEG